MSSDIICARCGKHLLSVEEARAHKCVVRDELSDLRKEIFTPLPKIETGRPRPPPPAPYPIFVEEPKPRGHPHTGATVLAITLVIIIIIILILLVRAYLAS